MPRFTLAETDAEHKLGAYLHYADASFAGSRPFKAATAAKQEGLLYERYTSREAQQQQDKDSGSAALTSLQTRYLRPVKGTQPPIKTTRMLTLPKVPQPPMRALPNGVPVSRIEHHSARRGARSPPRYGSPQPTQQQQQQDSSPRYGSPSQNIVQSQGTELEAFLAELGSIEALAPQPSQSRLAKPGPSQGGSPGVSGGGASSAAAPGMPLQRMTSTVLKPKSMMPGEGLGGSSAPPAALSAQSVSAAAAALRQKSIAGRAGASRLELLASQPGQTSGKTGEPLLDDAFYSALQDHFR